VPGAEPVPLGRLAARSGNLSCAGLAGYLADVHVNWGLAAAVTTAAIAGSLLGGKLAGRIREDVLRKAFGWFVLGMGVFVLAQQLPAKLWTSPQMWTPISALTATIIGIVLALRRRKSEHSVTSHG
jgi:uncharacterized membrane protein YqgA involved in biofilm formation